jgi:16S rRNA (guanine(966)-N(2))-methyltransferase RsmD
MRVIAGEFRSRRLLSPSGLEVRPTPDRLREALFNVLAPVIAESVFVDCYAGAGSVGIEALSRGAFRAIFIERSRHALAVLRENLRSLGVEARAQVIHGGAATYLGSVQGGIYFLDPPYERTEEYERALGILGAAGGSPLVIAQHSSKQQLPESAGALRRYRVLRQGENSLSFYRTG